MYKVLIVDDEKIIRIALKSIINWETEGFTICGTAPNSSSALEVIQEQHPDLIITDVVMPETNGIEFIKQLRQQDFSGPIVILSNYSDFNYAVEALHNNAFDYMLKTDISPESLISVLKRIKSHLDQHNNQNGSDNSVSTNHDALLLCEVLQQKKYSSANFSEPYFFLDIFLRSKVLRQKAEITIPDHSLKNLIQEIPGLAKYPVAEQSKDSLILLIPQKEQTAFFSSFLESKRKIRELINLYMNNDCGFAVSNAFDDPHDLHNKFKQLPSIEQLVMYEGFYNVIKENDLSLYQNDTINLAPLLRKIQDALNSENYYKCKKLLEETFHDLKQGKFCIPTTFQVLSRLNTFIIFDNSIYLEHAQEQLQQIAVRYHQCCTLDEHLVLIGELIDLVDSQKSALHSPALREEIKLVDKYIEKNLGKKITLSMLAKECNISENYLSRLFKSETGTNIITYVNSKKMQRAKELLSCSQYSIKEISASLGFDEPAYFNKIFNKIYHINPSDYRKLISSSYTNSSGFDISSPF